MEQATARVASLEDLAVAYEALSEVRPFFDSQLGRDIALAIVSGEEPDLEGGASEDAECNSVSNPKDPRPRTF